MIQELTRQQKAMCQAKTHRVDDRIVSITQPHVRPIVRGKAKANVEFGAKVAVSLVNGCARIEQMQWETFDEGQGLQAAVEAYRERYGCYLEAVLADKLYRTRADLQYCRERGIRLSVITLQMLVMNLERRLRILFAFDLLLMEPLISPLSPAG